MTEFSFSLIVNGEIKGAVSHQSNSISKSMREIKGMILSGLNLSRFNTSIVFNIEQKTVTVSKLIG